METVRVTIDGQEVEVPSGSTILEAARIAGVDIPTLCYHPDLDVKAMCRVCVVEVVGARTLQAACTQPVSEGMIVKTSSPLAREARRMNVELILSNHPQDCLNCIRNQKCELQTLAEKLGIREQRFERRSRTKNNLDLSSPSLVRDMEKCILCRRCVAVCQQVQGVSALGRLTAVLTPSLPRWAAVS